MRISDWSSDVCSSDLTRQVDVLLPRVTSRVHGRALTRAVGRIIRRPLDGGGLGILVVAVQRRSTRCLHVTAESPTPPVESRFLRAAGLAEPVRRPMRAGATAQKPRFSSRCLQVMHKVRSEEHTSELQSLMRISYAVFCLKKKK